MSIVTLEDRTDLVPHPIVGNQALSISLLVFALHSLAALHSAGAKNEKKVKTLLSMRKHESSDDGCRNMFCGVVISFIELIHL